MLLSDNHGIAVPPGFIGFTPIHGTGGVATDAATGGDETLTVVAGQSYALMTTAAAACIFGLADITTAANVGWFCPPSSILLIHIPAGYTTLHWEALVSGGGFYYTKLEQ
jgi:hypothetical protein